MIISKLYDKKYEFYNNIRVKTGIFWVTEKIKGYKETNEGKIKKLDKKFKTFYIYKCIYL